MRSRSSASRTLRGNLESLIDTGVAMYYADGGDLCSSCVESLGLPPDLRRCRIQCVAPGWVVLRRERCDGSDAKGASRSRLRRQQVVRPACTASAWLARRGVASHMASHRASKSSRVSVASRRSCPRATVKMPGFLSSSLRWRRPQATMEDYLLPVPERERDLARGQAGLREDLRMHLVLAGRDGGAG